ncbi:MAG: conjugative relaxase, partial [Calditrichaeota bacterium]
MLRIIQNTSAQGAKSYYTDALTKGDYYTKNHPQEIIGNWGGKIAKDLGIVGQVDQKRFESLVDNVHPETGIQLNPRTNNFRRVGYDFNFHCPKSVSVVYALQKDDSILAAFRESVQEAMQEVESEMKTRVRKNHQNDDRQTGNMLWAEFVHTTARPVNKVPDPHLHAHCFSFNTTYDSEEQRFKAGQFGDIKRDAPYYEAVFHAHFSKKLADLGYPIKRTDKGWELAGVPQSLIDKFSRRTEEIEKIAKEQGVTSAQKKDKLGAKTREKKQEELDQKQLENTWMNRLNASERLALTRVKSVSMHHISARDSVNHAINHMFERSSVVDRKRMAAQAMSAGYGSVSVAEMKNTLGRSSLITKTFENQTLCTTREALAEEKQITLLARAGRGQCAPFMGKVDNFSHKKLSAEQNAAIKHILYSQDQVVGISGKAGTGKTTLMQATVKAIEKSGKKVYTFAPSAEASRGVLRSEGFKQAETVATLLKNKEWQGKVKGQVIWIDESGLLSNRQMQELLSLAHQSHTRIILSGDDLQHKSVERGDAQRIVQDYAGIKFAQIEMIRRQQGAYKDAVEELSNGNISQGMDTLDQMGAVRECADDKRYEQLAEEYARLVRQKKSVLVVSPTHQEGAITTTHIRTVLRKTGKLGKSEKKINQQRNLQLTMAERMNPEQYHNSQVIQFHQNTTGFKAGEKAIVVKRTHNSIV